MSKVLKLVTSLIFLVFLFLAGCNEQKEIVINLETTTVPTQPSRIPSLVPLEEVNSKSIEITPLETIIQNDVSVTLSWIYADRFRIGISYEVNGVDIPDGYRLFCPVNSMTINVSPENLQASYTNYGDSGGLITICSAQNDGSFFITHNFYLPQTNTDSNTELNVDIDISIGGVLVTTDTGINASLPDYGVFHFQKTVLNNGDLTIEKNESITRDDMTITLSRVEINPYLVNAYLCMDYENQKMWYPEIFIQPNNSGINILPIRDFRTDMNLEDLTNWFEQFTNHRCFRYTFPLERFASPSNSLNRAKIVVEKVTVDALQAMSEDDCNTARERVQQSYPDLDFTCLLNDRGDGGYGVFLDIVKIPDGMERFEAQTIAEESFVNFINGPWTFLLSFP